MKENPDSDTSDLDISDILQQDSDTFDLVEGCLKCQDQRYQNQDCLSWALLFFCYGVKTNFGSHLLLLLLWFHLNMKSAESQLYYRRKIRSYFYQQLVIYQVVIASEVTHYSKLGFFYSPLNLNCQITDCSS